MPIGEGCAVQEDNVAVEFNTPPCASADEFVKSIQFNLSFLKQRAAELELDLCIKPSGVFDDDQLESEAAQVFGCDPDFNAWDRGRQNPRPSAPNKNLRSCRWPHPHRDQAGPDPCGASDGPVSWAVP
jgi:hypothetical protein